MEFTVSCSGDRDERRRTRSSFWKETMVVAHEDIRGRSVRWNIVLVGLLLHGALGSVGSAMAASAEAARERIASDVAAGRAIVVHVVVALCDNEHQGIVPVPTHLGNGRDPRGNLYWGAMYGLKNYFQRSADWVRVAAPASADARILERVVLTTRIEREDVDAKVYVVADAWDGAEIEAAIETFLDIAGGGSEEEIEVASGSERATIFAGGSAHVQVFVGHNGLMDFHLPPSQPMPRRSVPASSVVLACASEAYFRERLQAMGAHCLVLTTGLMAPEAYTLDAVLRSWIGGQPVEAVLGSAAEAYHRYQNCGVRAATRLFWGDDS
jgi:hypothetical protein